MSDAAARLSNRELSLGVLRDVLGFHVTLASIVTLDQYARHLGGPLELRKTEFALLMLLLANGPTPARRLAQALRQSAPQLTMLLDGMQARNWLRRESNPADRRARLIVLTRDGTALARRAAVLSRSMELELAASLSAAERAMLIELLMKVAGHRQAPVAEAVA